MLNVIVHQQLSPDTPVFVPSSSVVGSSGQRSLAEDAHAAGPASRTEAVGPRRRLAPRRCCRKVVVKALWGGAECAAWTRRSYAAAARSAAAADHLSAVAVD